MLARADAEEHCRRLAAWHRAATVRAQVRVGRVLALLLAVIAGCLVLAAAVPAVQGVMADQGIDITASGDWSSPSPPVAQAAAPVPEPTSF